MNASEIKLDLNRLVRKAIFPSMSPIRSILFSAPVERLQLARSGSGR